MKKYILIGLIVCLLLISGCVNQSKECYIVSIEPDEINKINCNDEYLERSEELLPEENLKIKRIIKGSGYRRSVNILVWEDDKGDEDCVCYDVVILTNQKDRDNGCQLVEKFFSNDESFSSCLK